MTDRNDRLEQTITATTKQLMTAVVRSGCIRQDVPSDVTCAVRIMREELKAFIVADEDKDGKYVDERALALQGQSGLAMASLVAECIRRVIAERQQVQGS